MNLTNTQPTWREADKNTALFEDWKILLSPYLKSAIFHQSTIIVVSNKLCDGYKSVSTLSISMIPKVLKKMILKNPVCVDWDYYICRITKCKHSLSQLLWVSQQMVVCLDSLTDNCLLMQHLQIQWILPKLNYSSWPDINLVLYFIFIFIEHAFALITKLGRYPTILTSCLIDNTNVYKNYTKKLRQDWK